MNDLISRRAAIKAIEELQDCYNGFSDTYDKACIIGVLEEVPSAQRTGKWKPFDLTWGRSVYFCTACNDATEIPTFDGKPMYKFCPYCGAKMEEESK